GETAHRHGVDPFGVGDAHGRLGDRFPAEAGTATTGSETRPHVQGVRALDRRRVGRRPAVCRRGRVAARRAAGRRFARRASPLTREIARHVVQRTAIVLRTMYDELVRHTKSDDHGGPTESAGGIVATGLGKRYGDLWALRDLDLAVAPGSVL